MTAFTVTTLGCKVNQYESEAIGEILTAHRWRRVPTGDTPDLSIINTCTVTAKANAESRQAVRRQIRAYPYATVMVTGCGAQRDPTGFATIPGVHWVVGNSWKGRIPQLLNQALPCGGPAVRVEEIRGVRRFQDLPITRFEGRARCFVKIQDGCDAFCSYCIVPYVRGPSRSLDGKTVLNRLQALKAAGYDEAVLCGIHLGRYGRDLQPSDSLLDLLRRADDLRDAPRLRLSSIEPKELTEGLIDYLSMSRRVCPHLHIPLQSGDDEILKTMNRPYGFGYFEWLVHRISHALPMAAVGVDCLVGFPGETQAAFEKTCERIERLPVSYLHVFPFSPQAGTPAATMKRQVTPSVVKRRCEYLRILGKEKRRRFHHRFIGTRAEAIFEEKLDPETKQRKGVTGNYIPVFMDGSQAVPNRITDVRLDRMEGDRMIAEGL